MSRLRDDLLPLTVLVLIGSCAFMNLMAIPAFEDEGTQLRWVWRLREVREWVPALSFGKPLEAWPVAPLLLQWLNVQPLLTIRAVHVVVGIVGVVLTYRLALRLTDRATAFVSALLFAICPFVVYMQRFALVEILLCTCGVWVLLSVLKLMETPTWGRAVEAAVALVLAAICKLPVGFVLMLSVPMALLVAPAELRRSLLEPPARRRVLAALTPGVALASAIAVIAIVLVHLGHRPGFGLQDAAGIGMGGYTDIAGALGIARPTLLGELTAQLTLPVVLLGSVGLVVSAVTGDWRQRWLLLMGLIPMLAIGLLARFWYSRYLVFTLPPLIVCATCGWRHLARGGWRHLSPGASQTPSAGARQRLIAGTGRWPQAAGYGALALCAALMAQQSARLIFDPMTARWSTLDRWQYFQGWGSGFGYPEAATFIREAPEPPAMIYSLDGHSAYQLRNYLPAEWRSRVAPVIYGPDGAELSGPAARLQNLLSHTPAWVVIAEPLLERYLASSFGDLAGAHVSLVEIARFNKPTPGAPLALYQVAQQARGNPSESQPLRPSPSPP